MCSGPEGRPGMPTAGAGVWQPFRGAYVSVLAAACGPLVQTCVTLFIISVQGEDLQPEEDEPARELQPEEVEPARELQPEDDDFLMGGNAEDRFEPLETGTFHEGNLISE